MRQNFITYIYTFFFLFLSEGIFAQQFTLKITSNNKEEKSVLKKVNFSKTHLNEVSIKTEANSVSEKLQWLGYFSNQIDSIVKKDSIYTSYFTLGQKIKKATITIPSNIEPITSSTDITLNTEEIAGFLNSISNKLDKAGKSFSEVLLKNIYIKNKKLFAKLIVNPSKKRTIDNIIIKGYEKFSKSHLKHFLGLKVGSIFNQQKLRNVSSAVKSLNFVSEMRAPEVLFSKDSTTLYVYLKKNKINNFDGLISFASKENNDGLLFNGHINLELNNILHTGEHFNLTWRANGQEKQDFNISTRIPYIFNSKFSPELSFNIYRQDSTFLNTKLYSALQYAINPKTSVALTYNSENSENTLKDETKPSVADFDNSFLGLQFEYRIPANNTFFDDTFYLKLNPSFGARTSNNQKENQSRIHFETSYLYQLNYRSSVFIRNKTGYLHSNSFLDNEMYRIGGVNSIRGFNEQSIFTPQFSYFNIEYRYLTSQSSYLYTITDLGQIKSNLKKERLLSLGLGYLFKINNTQLNLGYTVGKKTPQTFDFKDSKLIFSIKSLF